MVTIIQGDAPKPAWVYIDPSQAAVVDVGTIKKKLSKAKLDEDA